MLKEYTLSITRNGVTRTLTGFDFDSIKSEFDMCRRYANPGVSMELSDNDGNIIEQFEI